MNERLDGQIKGLAQKLTQGRIDRRQFMTGATAMGLSVVLASTMAGRALADVPKRGGTFRIGLANGATTDTLDPAAEVTSHEVQMEYNIRNSLVEIGSDNRLTAELAESWEASKGASQWVFKLRTGVEFHNGKTFDSGDVLATINHHRSPSSTSPAKSFLQPLQDMKADGPNTVIFTLSGGDADFPYILSDYHMGIMPSDSAGNALWKDGIGTGGYKVDSFDPGVRSFHSRFSNYWKEGHANFDAVEIKVVADVGARTAGLTSGQLDAIDEVELQTLNLLAQNSNVAIDEVTSGAHVTMPMLMDVAPFNNNDVRMALKLAINRQALVDTILSGHGTVGNDQPIASVIPYYANLPQRTYDPDQAKFHLKKAGLETLKVSLSAADTAFPGAVDAATLFREHAAKAGIEIDVVHEPDDGYWSNVWRKKPFVVAAWGARPTPGIMFALTYADGAAWNDLISRTSGSTSCYS